MQAQFARIIGLAAYLPEELQIAAANVDDPSALCHLVASTLRLKTEERQELLETVSIHAPSARRAEDPQPRARESELGSRIQSQVASEIEQGQREYFLRQQLKAIREELGEASDEAAEVEELRTQVAEKALPEEIRKAVDRELGRLERLPSAAAEHGVIRTYVDWILTLPWSESTEDHLDLRRARRILDEDHFDLDKVKERIIEYLAVSKLKDDLSGPILCFVGPPGVGKTSLGQSIARALGRTFQRLSVGGVRDQAEIKGHRRTYIGAMPGTILRALRDAGSRNPVVLIDEIDKMGADFRGDRRARCSSARPRAELDLPRPLPRPAVRPLEGAVSLHRQPARDDPAAAARPHGHHPALGLHGGREAGHRQEVPRASSSGARADEGTGDAARRDAPPRDLRLHARGRRARAGAAARRAAAQGRDADREGQGEADPRGRGARTRVARAASLLRRRHGGGRRHAGVATGLAYTAFVGGDVLFIEATAYPGEGRLRITGQLGEE